ncbi:MAG: VWA domain-containing protein [Acidobacteriota bacterium]
MKTIPILLLSVLSAIPLAAQSSDQPEQPFKEKLDVNLVLVDATVTDRRGNQILGLGKDDFVVKEDGTPQEIASVDYFTNRTLLDSPETKAAFKVERVHEERYFIIFFDKLLGAPIGLGLQSELLRVKRSAGQFIDEQLKPQDKVAIVGHDARLKIYADFTSDKRILKKALDDAVMFSDGLSAVPAYADDFSIMKNLNMGTMMYRTGRVYDAVRVLADALPQVPARKVMAMFSVGIGDTAPNMPEFLENDDTYYRPMVQALNEANVSVYAINLLRNVVGHYPQEDTLSRMASATGGEYFRNVVNFTTPLKQIEKANNGYYMLSYYSNKPRGESGYQKINVSLRNPEFRIKAREGYVYGDKS